MRIVQFYRQTHCNKREGYNIDIVILYPHKSMFLLSRFYDMASNSDYCFEITIWKLIPLIIIYSLRTPYHKILYFMRLLGFLKTKDHCMLSLKDFTLKFWKYKIKKEKNYVLSE